MARRDTLEKAGPMEGITEHVIDLWKRFSRIFSKALDFRAQNTTKADTWEAFKEIIQNKGGFVSAHWDGTPETEEQIKTKQKRPFAAYRLTMSRKRENVSTRANRQNSGFCFALAY